MTAKRTDAPADALPVGSLKEAVPYLRRPFTPEAIRFKVQSVFSGASGCLIVSYIDARLVIERLNLVVPDLWSAVNEPIPGTKLMVCRLTIDGVTREDVGESSKGMSKDLYSDALKRAAVHFGVGVSVYALAQIKLFMKNSNGRIEVREVTKKGGQKEKTITLTDHGTESLRGGYRKWLERQTSFGDALDHGDVEDAGGIDPEPEETEEQFEPAPPAPLDDEEAGLLTARVRAAYEKVDRSKVTPEKFNGWLINAAHSHDELERLAIYLEGMKEGSK